MEIMSPPNLVTKFFQAPLKLILLPTAQEVVISRLVLQDEVGVVFAQIVVILVRRSHLIQVFRHFIIINMIIPPEDIHEISNE